MANEVTKVSNCNSPGCTGDCKTQIMMPCEVCSLVRNDTRVKHCFYCTECKAYICCKLCRYDFPNRALAATIKLGSKVVEKVKEVFTGKPENEKTKTSNRRSGKRNQPDDISGRV